MELPLYKIIATCANTAEVMTFDYIPENFEGVKITQKFYFDNPMGYQPKASIDTLRAVDADKNWLDFIFNLYGLESDVTLEIQKLNALGNDYDILPYNFAIDFESYEEMDVYSEFALKSVSVIDDYNLIKNTEIQLPLTETALIPTTQKYINYVSLKSKGLFPTNADTANFTFEKNNESKFYDGDSSLLDLIGDDDYTIYMFGQDVSTSATSLIISAKLNLVIGATGQQHSITLYKKTATAIDLIHTFFSSTGTGVEEVVDVNLNATVFNLGICDPNDYLYIEVEAESALNFSILGTFFIDIKKQTDVLVFDENPTLNHISISNVLDSIFNNNAVYTDNDEVTYNSLTSQNSLTKKLDTIVFKPKDFLNDFCVTTGQIVNYRLDGKVRFMQIYKYFNYLLTDAKAIEVANYNDLSIKYSTDLQFVGAEVGVEPQTYDNYTYLIDWNKVLTFKQENRKATEVISLVPAKFRTDFSGMLDSVIKRSKQETKNLKDNYIFNPNFSYQIDGDYNIYDLFNPRDILERWRRFISFAFQNFGKNTLTISSDGGTPDNLAGQTENQMDDVILSETPRLLPIEFNFTCALENIDFSENILKLTYNSEIIYIFVVEAETTDSLSEQKIRGLKIQL